MADRYAKQAPRLRAKQVTSPVDLSTATSRSVTVSGTTTAPTVYLSVNGVKQQIDVTGGAFQRPDHAADGQQQIVVAAVGKNGGGAGGPDGHCLRPLESVASRTRAATTTDPEGYVYPTDGAFNPGSFDLTGFDVYRDGDSVRLVTSVRGAINNPGVATA